MRKPFLVVVALFAIASFPAIAQADGPSGSTECHINDDDCDGAIDEDTGGTVDDNDSDGRIDEDPIGDANGDGNLDDDLDGAVDEDTPDDDADGSVN